MKNTFNTGKVLRYLSFSLVLFLMFMGFAPKPCQAQLLYDYEWMMGYNNNLEGSAPGSRFAVNKISFHSNPPDTIRTNIYGSTGVFKSASMCDSEGRLIYYSNGCRLFLPDGSLMEGGEVLIPGPFTHRLCDGNFSREAGRALPQSMVSLPMDDRDSLFFVIHKRCDLTHQVEIDDPVFVVCDRLYITRVHKTGEGSYRAEPAEEILTELHSMGENVSVRDTAPHHWWIIVPPHPYLNNYRAIRLGPDGVDTTVTYEADYQGLPFDDGRWVESSAQGAMCPLGKTYVRWVPLDTVGSLVFDFDRARGTLSNLRHLPHPETHNFFLQASETGGASISPNGRFLYVNTMYNLFQYDLHAANIEESMVHIAEFDGFLDPGNNFPTYFFTNQMGPDCRIYVVSNNTVRYMHVIRQPNRKGLACDFRQHSFALPGNHSWNIPYHPSYRLDSEYAICDSTVTGLWFIPEEELVDIRLYPNPARDYVVVGWSGWEPTEVRVYDFSGRLLAEEAIPPSSPEYYMSLNGYQPGMYLVSLRDREGRMRTERLVVME